jgi:predicted nucleotidyltransferase
MSLQIDPDHLVIVSHILKKHGVVAFVFGSRARGTARPLSDLDLCIKDSVSKNVLMKLKEDFEESDLPFKVDIVEWKNISSEFIKMISADLVRLVV